MSNRATLYRLCPDDTGAFPNRVTLPYHNILPAPDPRSLAGSPWNPSDSRPLSETGKWAESSGNGGENLIFSPPVAIPCRPLSGRERAGVRGLLQ